MDDDILIIEWIYNFSQLYIELIKGVSWPLAVIFIVLLLKSRVSKFFIKHNGTEVQLETINKIREGLNEELQSVEKAMPEVGRKLQVQIDDLYKKAKKAVSGNENKVIKGSNSAGCYTLYGSGYQIMELTIQPGSSDFPESYKTFYFPALMSKVASVTFVGEEVPVIVGVSNHDIKLRFEKPNSKTIKVIVGGMS